MADSKLQPLLDAAAKATPGPWKATDKSTYFGGKVDVELMEVVHNHDDAVIFWTGFDKSDVGPQNWNNAVFIAAARNSIPEIQRLVSLELRLRGYVGELRNLTKMDRTPGVRQVHPDWVADRLESELERKP